MAKTKNVVGVSWRRFRATPSPRRRKSGTPSGRTLRSQATSTSIITNVQAEVMKRMTSVRGTLDTLRQKVKLPTRRHKRLTNGALTPFGSAERTPSSSQRKRQRQARREVKMYSPFECLTPTPARATPATPSRTPGQSIRMGTRPCKRFVFSTPGRQDMENEVHELANNMMSLRSTCTPSPACPPPSGQAASRQIIYHWLGHPSFCRKTSVQYFNTVSWSSESIWPAKTCTFGDASKAGVTSEKMRSDPDNAKDWERLC